MKHNYLNSLFLVNEMWFFVIQQLGKSHVFNIVRLKLQPAYELANLGTYYIVLGVLLLLFSSSCLRSLTSQLSWECKIRILEMRDFAGHLIWSLASREMNFLVNQDRKLPNSFWMNSTDADQIRIIYPPLVQTFVLVYKPVVGDTHSAVLPLFVHCFNLPLEVLEDRNVYLSLLRVSDTY